MTVVAVKGMVEMFVQMHKTVMGATLYFWWGIVGVGPAAELRNAIKPLMGLRTAPYCDSLGDLALRWYDSLRVTIAASTSRTAKCRAGFPPPGSCYIVARRRPFRLTPR